jgi:two-component system, cell cycle sensor histidine kinase and response regulator CckA
MTQAPGRILIADDEPSLLKMMGTYLGRLGFRVATADTTGQAWAEVERSPGEFAVAVLDASMPGMSMHDLALRILAANPSVRVLASSGYPVDMTVLETAAPGRVAFLQKPFTPQMLAEALRRMLASQEEGL